jgi:ferrous iron transport protein B
MALIFWLSFNVVGAYLQDLCAAGVEILTDIVAAALSSANVNGVLYGLIIDGAFQGVGAVLSFIPIILCLFFFLSMLEDSGYMARIAFVTDKLLRKIGLSGRSIVPMLIGFGCSVPAIMASRTLPSERDRKMTIMMTPFMSCTAKLPIYGFFCNLFFPEHAGLIMVGLYFLGIVTGILLALLSKGTVFRGEAVPFVMELPNYRLPGIKNVWHLLWDKAKDFLQRAFTVIFLASIIVWALQSFDFSLNLVTDSKDSILAGLAGVLAPIFSPQGFGDWRIVTALIAGFMAKESVVSTLTVLFGEGGIVAVLGVSSAASLLVFCLLYTPCVAAIASVRRELGGKWALAMIALQCGVAWIVSLVVSVIF